MKKLFVIMVVMIVAFSANAQLKVNYTFANDTITDAETIYLTYPKDISSMPTIAFGFTLTEVSGAATAITAIVQESVESGKWSDIGTASTLVTTGSPNEISKVFSVANTPSLRYRVKIVQTGTAVTKVLGAKFIAK